MPEKSPDTSDNTPSQESTPIRPAQMPEFIPLPCGDKVEFYSGLKRSKLNQLILPCAENDWNPPVKSVSLRPRGCTKGKRLIVLSSLLEYLRRQEA